MGKQSGGFFLLPANQLLRPWGEQTVIPGRPVDMAYDSQRRVLAVLNTRSILLLDGSTGTKVAEIPARNTSYAGIAYRPGDRELWASETTRNGPDSILITKISDVGMPGESSRIGLNGHPLPTGIAFSPDGRLAYVAFSRSNTLAVIDADSLEMLKEINVGMAPFGVVAAGGSVFVSNRAGTAGGAAGYGGALVGFAGGDGPGDRRIDIGNGERAGYEGRGGAGGGGGAGAFANDGRTWGQTGGGG